MALVKAANPAQIFGRDSFRALTAVSRWKGLALVAHAWGVIIALAWGAAYLGTWWAWIIAVLLIGGRQLGLAILMHEGAHGLLHPNRAINNWVGQWITGVPMGTDLHAYRTYHLTHHRYTQQPEDPDLSLSAPFPTTRASMLRKVFRDLTGQTFLKQRSAQVMMAMKGFGPGAKEQNLFVGKVVLRFLGAQVVLLALSFATGLGVTPYLVWLIALATTFQLYLRIRNVAEHACTATGSEDPFTHARTTHANWLERATVAPYWVNFHSEHHLFMGVPCYNLPRAHRMLVEGGHADRMTIAPGYLEVMRQVIIPSPAAQAH